VADSAGAGEVQVLAVSVGKVNETSAITLDIDFSNISTNSLDLGISGPSNIKFGTSIFSQNPIFRNPDNIAGADGVLQTPDDGLTLTGGPCINAGTTDGVYSIDILGEPRIKDGKVDLGAYRH
jgi:hypothetical protein